jgi:transcription elongation factor Elf1
MATTTTKTLRTFKLSCPLCGEAESLKLDLSNLASVECGSCGESMSPESARKLVAEQLRRWNGLIAWINLAGEVMAEAEAE